jgi:cation diffusion facilitator CzcD-associated flavoprotein CzcO
MSIPIASSDSARHPDVDVDVDVVVVGAGFAGMYMLHRLRQIGCRARVFERADDVGGTWYWNRYPGARCDIESVEYSYSFDDALQQDWVWTERFATQPEILRYAQHVADRFDLRVDIVFGVDVRGAEFNDASRTWTVSTSDGAVTVCRFVITAVGCLSSMNMPELPGHDQFAGQQVHTGGWPHDGVDFTGLRVGVIGNGSSGIQCIPEIARQAAHLTAFQRTPAYTAPAGNRPLTSDELAAVKADYAQLRAANRQMSGAYGSRTRRGSGSAFDVNEESRNAEYERRWAGGGLTFLHGFSDLLTDATANDTAADFVRRKIAEIVDDPQTAAALMPTHVIGCKRLCLDTGYYATFNRPNVSLVDLRSNPIETLTPTGIRAGGVDHDLDIIVYATGFDAMTGSLLKMDLRGPDTSLADAWKAGPTTYLGVAVAGLPNLFIITGPGSPSVLTNVIASIEHHVEWISDCISAMQRQDATRIEATPDAQADWVAHVNSVAAATLYPTCNSWYLGANVPGKPRVFMPLPGHPPYVERCEAVAANGYEGFVLS